MLNSIIPEDTENNQSTILPNNVEILANTGEVLEDVPQNSAKNKARPWKENKEGSWMLAESYQRLGLGSKAGRVRDCGNFLTFNECTTHGYKKLKTANFCKVRLCPMCSWRRSLVVFAQLTQILHKAQELEPKTKYAFLTLTMKNVPGDQLPQAIDELFHAWDKLLKRRELKGVITGWFRGLEVTHNLKEDTYHPHFHVLLAVKPGYFSGLSYIKQERWMELWKESLGVDYMPVVDIRKVKPKREGQTFEGAAAESAKYAVKSSDYIIGGDQHATDQAVEVLDKALANRRLIAYGGLLSKARKALKLKDVEDADLVHTDEEDKNTCTCPICNSDLVPHLYTWNFGLKNYIG